MTEERAAFGAAPLESVGPWVMRITHPDRLQCAARRNSPFGRGAAAPVSAGTSFRSRCANVVSGAKLLWKRNCGRKRMSIKGRTSGAARSIRVASQPTWLERTRLGAAPERLHLLLELQHDLSPEGLAEP